MTNPSGRSQRIHAGTSGGGPRPTLTGVSGLSQRIYTSEAGGPRPTLSGVSGLSQRIRAAITVAGGGLYDRTVWGGPFYGDENQYPGDPLPMSAPFPLGPNVWTGYRTTLVPALTPDGQSLAGWLNETPPQPGGQWPGEFPIWWDEPFTMLAVPVVDGVRLEDVELFVVTAYEDGDAWYGAWNVMRGQDGRPAGTYPEAGLDVIISEPFDYGQSIDGAVAFVVPGSGDPDGNEWVVGPTTDGFYSHVERVVPAFGAVQDVEWTVGLWRIGEG